MKELRKRVIRENVQIAQKEGFDEQKVIDIIFNNYSELIKDMDEDQKYEYCHSIADIVEESIYLLNKEL